MPGCLHPAGNLRWSWNHKRLRLHANRLAEDSDLGAIIMAHTHRPALEEPTPGQIYLNPGAWMEGYRYGVLNDEGGVLATFS